jgi:hypothetical protein
MFAKISRGIVSIFSVRFLVKFVAYVLVVVVFAASVAVIVDPAEMEIFKAVGNLTLVDPLPRTRELVQENRLCEAIDYLGHFMDYDYVKSNQEAQELYQQLNAKRDSLSFRGQDVLNGILRGKGECTEALVSATVSDFLLVGDVRDLTWGLVNKYYYKEPTDDFTTALAALGVLLWGTTAISIPTAPVTGGTGTAGSVSAKAAVVLLKLANKMGKLSNSMKKSLVKVFRQTTATKSIAHFKPIASAVQQMASTPGIKVKDSLNILAASRHVDDLPVMAKAAAAYGRKTGKFLDLAGDASVRVYKRFPQSSRIVPALDAANMRGKPGLDALEKVGPDKFLKYLTIAKFSTRGVRSWHEGRLSELTAMTAWQGWYAVKKAISYLPMWLMYVVAVISGLVVIGPPLKGLRKIWQRLRKSASASEVPANVV